MRLLAENALLLEVKEELIPAIPALTEPVNDNTVSIEIDNNAAPATAGEYYYIVTPEGITPGPHSRQGDQIVHLVMRFGVTVAMRVPENPRDRQSADVYLETTTGLNAKIDAAATLLHFSYGLLGRTNTRIDALSSKFGKFYRPPVIESIGPPETVDASMYAARSTPRTGTATPVVILRRKITFSAQYQERIE